MNKDKLLTALSSLGLIMIGVIFGWISYEPIVVRFAYGDNYTFSKSSVNAPSSHIIPPHQESMEVEITSITSVSPSGFYINFTTETQKELFIEWCQYPSDIFVCDPCRTDDGFNHNYCLEIYPEGGTVVFRFYEGALEEFRNTRWFYQNLPRPDNGTIIPPPYLNIKK